MRGTKIEYTDCRYDAKKLAEWIVCYASKAGKGVTNIQLQKILYEFQKHYFRENNVPAFSDDFEAGNLVAVIPDIYYTYCSFGYDEIKIYSENGFNPGSEDLMFLQNLILDTKEKPWYKLKEEGKAYRKVFDKETRSIIPKYLIRKEARGNFFLALLRDCRHNLIRFFQKLS